MDHADLHIVGLQPLELICEALFDLSQFPGALVLPILPDGTQMSLEHEFLPPSPQGPAQVRAKLRVRSVEVDAVDPARLHSIHHFLDLLIGLIHKALTAHADFADQQARAAQLTIFHFTASLLFF